jgi:hypothetical protein
VGSGGSGRPQYEVPYLHVRPPRRIVDVGGEGLPLAHVTANRAALLMLRDQVDAALRAEEGKAVMVRYRETDKAGYDFIIQKASRRVQMGEAREPDPPD